MAQLPPKVPAMTPNWLPFPHHTISNNNFFADIAIATNPENNNQSKRVDEFLDFASARRGVHRRSISDSITFLETANECNNGLISGNLGFDKLEDDEQLMSMFFDEMSLTLPPPSTSSNPSTPSDQNSNNDEKSIAAPSDQQSQPQQEQELKVVQKTEPGEVESSFDQEQTQHPTFLDPKRVKRIIANRQSAQRSRVRKLQYISELEHSVTTLQTEVSALSPRVAFLDHQRLILNVDNSALKQRIAALAQDKIFKDAHQEALKKEIERLRQIYHQQSLKKMHNNSSAPPHNHEM